MPQLLKRAVSAVFQPLNCLLLASGAVAFTASGESGGFKVFGRSVGAGSAPHAVEIEDPPRDASEEQLRAWVQRHNAKCASCRASVAFFQK